jgi:hypothetical protein
MDVEDLELNFNEAIKDEFENGFAVEDMTVASDERGGGLAFCLLFTKKEEGSMRQKVRVLQGFASDGYEEIDKEVDSIIKEESQFGFVVQKIEICNTESDNSTTSQEEPSMLNFFILFKKEQG